MKNHYSYNFHIFFRKWCHLNFKECIILKLKEKFFIKKNVNQFLYTEIEWPAFFDGEYKNIESNFEIAPKIVMFFQPQINFCTQTNNFLYFFLYPKFNFCVHNVVLDAQNSDFYPFH